MSLSAPKELNYLNFAQSIQEWPVVDKTLTFSAIFTLSDKVIIQKRVVFDIFMMFGEVGGLYDFLILVLSSFFHLISS